MSNLVAPEQAKELDRLLKIAGKRAIENVLKENRAAQAMATEEGGGGGENDSASTLIIAMAATLGMGAFHAEIRKLLLGDLNAALIKDE